MRIKIIAPARAIERSVADRVLAVAARVAPTAELVFDPQCFASDGGHFAGLDEVRTAAFVAAANDPAVDAVWFARGGYGSNRILAAALPQLTEAARSKPYLGYSDMGFLLGALYAARIGRPIHGPMTGDVARVGGEDTIARSLNWLTRRDPAGLEPGLDRRPAAAFNLSILGALIGSPYLPDLADHVLIVEEVSEPLYRVDRTLFQMAHAAQLRGIAGVRLGAVSAVVANEPGWIEPIETMIVRWCREMHVPYLGRAIIGHTAENRVVPFGMV